MPWSAGHATYEPHSLQTALCGRYGICDCDLGHSEGQACAAPAHARLAQSCTASTPAQNASAGSNGPSLLRRARPSILKQSWKGCTCLQKQLMQAHSQRRSSRLSSSCPKAIALCQVRAARASNCSCSLVLLLMLLPDKSSAGTVFIVARRDYVS